jgi:hypothetical protein
LVPSSIVRVVLWVGLACPAALADNEQPLEIVLGASGTMCHSVTWLASTHPYLDEDLTLEVCKFVQVRPSPAIFLDGFESGDLTRWQ